MTGKKLREFILLFACAAALSNALSAAARQVRLVERPAGEPVPVEQPWKNPRPPADVPLGHWSYPLLERLVARRILAIDLSTRPVSRTAVAHALLAARGLGRGARPVAGWLTEREAWALDRLRAEFLRGEVDDPSATHESGRVSVAVAIEALTEIRYGEESEGLIFWPGTIPGGPARREQDSVEGAVDGVDGGDFMDGPAYATAAGAPRDVGISVPGAQPDAAVDLDAELWGGVRDLAGFYATPSVLLGGQEGARTVRLSARTRTWRGIAAGVDRAYFLLEQPHYAVAAGRRGPAWGTSRHGRLLISGRAPTFDQLDARFSVGPLSFHALHAFLEGAAPVEERDGLEGDARSGPRGAREWRGDGDQAYLAAHRLAVAGTWGSVGLSEAVVYSGTIPDPVYMNPLFPFYLSQHNERENDNVAWSLDVAFRPLRGMDVYGEFLVDDLQYDRDREYPDKYGVTVGQTYYGSVGSVDVELTAEYTNVRNWTYTSRVTEHAFSHDGQPIGFELGPDADRLLFEAIFHPSSEWTVGVGYRRSREGEGALDDPFEEGDNHEPSFPSGVVDTRDRVTIEAGYQSLRGLSAGVGIAFESYSNCGNVSTADGDEWEVWAGVRFRI
jgi:hypothetical protein